jgi:hypothetical protein
MTISRLGFGVIMAFLLSTFAECVQCQPANLEEALALYRENKLDQARLLFEKLVDQDKNNPQEIAWLAETYRRLGKKEEAVRTARRALELDPRCSFAHTVIADASNPIFGEWAQANSDTTWFHLMKAIEYDSSDGNPWIGVWVEAIHRGDFLMTRRASKELVETGFLSKAALAYGRWMIQGLPEKAILITNGDMDTFPPCAVQEAESIRKDVVIVNRPLLNTVWYARFIRDEEGVPLPVDDAGLQRIEFHKDQQGNLITQSDQIIRGWLKQKATGAFSRPVTVSATVDNSFLSGIKSNLRFAGAFYEWSDSTSASIPDTALITQGLRGVTLDSLTGPWVSPQDRSPIRRTATKSIVRNVTLAAIVYGESLLQAKRISEASYWANWADELDGKAEVGRIFTERISQLKDSIAKTAR